MRWTVAVVAACGCYHPRGEVACTVTCDQPGAPCEDGLICGDDHLCFAETPCSAIDAGPDAHCDPTPTDLDGDCIDDAMDLCIAPASDAAGDLDADQVPNGTDPCPWDPGTGTDSDGDGIPDLCDPTSARERVRCVMAFGDPTLSSALWTQLGNDHAWSFAAHHATGDGSAGAASMVARRSLEGSIETTYDLVAHVSSGGGVLRIWVRAGGNRNLGCDVDTTTSPPTLGVFGSSNMIVRQPFAIDTAMPATLRVKARVSVLVPTKLDCSLAVIDSGATATIDDVGEPLPTGTFGITTIVQAATIDGLVIYDRSP